MRSLVLLAVMVFEATCYTMPPPQRVASRTGHVLMAKKPKKDHRVWLPKRSSRFAREVDVALQLVSRAAAGIKDDVALPVSNIVAQALVCDGISSEFATDTMIARESAATLQACDADAQKAALELINEIGATTPCVNAFDPPYPEAVKPCELTEADLGATLDKGNAKGVGERTWVLAPITAVEQPAVSLTLLEFGQPVMCAVALPALPRNSMSGEKLLRMTVSFDGQNGAVRPPDGSIMWAEEDKGAYERSVGGEHGTDVPLRVDRSLLGKRSIANQVVTGVQDFPDVTRGEAAAQPRAAKLAQELGMTKPPQQAGGPFVYGLIARGEVQTYFDLPDTADAFDSHIWAHAAGALLVKEAGGEVTDTVGNPLDFSACRASITMPETVVGVLATNKDLHADVVRQTGLASLAAAAK